MKLSLAFPDGEEDSPIVKAKVPISIFNQPFTSIFTSTTAPTTNNPDSVSDISFSLSTNFPSGPSLRLTYSPTSNNPSSFPLSLSLRSGLGLFGSPKDSPLTFSASFSVSRGSSCAIVPAFSLHFKPQLGQFSLRKRAASAESEVASNGSASSPELGGGSGSDGSLPGWQEVRLDPIGGEVKDEKKKKKIAPYNGSGGSIKVRTELPLNKRVLVNFRWGVCLPGCFGTKLPYLAMNKIGIETSVGAREGGDEVKGKAGSGKEGDLELLKGVCFWMRRDLELLEEENKEMKRSLEDMIRTGHNAQGWSNAVGKKGAPRPSGGEFEQRRTDNNSWGGSNAVGKKGAPRPSDGEFEQRRTDNNSRGGSNAVGKKGLLGSSGSSSSVSGFDHWKTSTSDGEASPRRESKKPSNRVMDLESELQKAIKAASC